MAKKCVLFFVLFLFLGFCFVKRVHAAQNTIALPFVEDTYVEQNFPTISPWNNRNIYIGTDFLYNKGKTRGIFKPDYQLLKNQGISPSKISTATLDFSVYVVQGIQNPIQLDLHEVQSSWSMYSVTWNNQPQSTFKSSMLINNQLGRKSIDIKAFIIDQYTKFLLSNATNGFIVRFTNEANAGIVVWATGCDAATSVPKCNVSDPPKINIDYAPNTAPPQSKIVSPATNSYLNTTTMNTVISPVVDPESDLVTYAIQSCKDEPCTVIEQTTTFTSNTQITVKTSEGQHYLRVIASDGVLQSISPTILVIVDTSKPAAPVLLPEPTLTQGTENNLFWQLSNEEVTYQLAWSESKVFTTSLTSPWISELHYTVTNLAEKLYYYRVRAKDKAGNMSDWSASVFSTQDTSIPKLTYFKSSKSAVSPKKDDNGEIIDNSYIQVRYDDKNLESVRLEIFNSKKQRVYFEEEKSKAYIWKHWPDSLDIPDDTYTLYGFAKDKVGSEATSDPLFVIVDKKAPPSAIITGIKNKEMTNNKNRTVKISCAESVYGKTYINNRIVKEFTTTMSQSFDFTDNDYTLKVLCRDAAENESTTSITFTIDTTPPKAPTLILKKGDTSILAQITCLESYPVQISVNGFVKDTITCGANGKIEYTKIDIPKQGKTVTVETMQQDSASNWSDIDRESYTSPLDTKLEKQALDCSYTYDLHLGAFSTTDCNWNIINTQKLYKSISKEQQAKNYIYTIAETSKIDATIKITTVTCKPFSFFDPLTWFLCVKVKVSESTEALRLLLVPAIDSRLLAMTGQTNNFLIYDYVTDKNLNQLSINTTLFGTKIVTQGGKKVPLLISHETTVVIESAELKTNNKFFSWLFENIMPVSQWHGNTAFQKPHAGIDFSVYKQKILAPADGTIISKGYDQSSKCMGGGYYISILHPNGLYTYYFHLDSEPSIKVGAQVKKGSFIATTGNSGIFDCKPLGYHLHHEVRTTRKSASHINPVPYYGVDWSQVKTAKATDFPGRLTGDNPHPKY